MHSTILPSRYGRFATALIVSAGLIAIVGASGASAADSTVPATTPSRPVTVQPWRPPIRPGLDQLQPMPDLRVEITGRDRLGVVAESKATGEYDHGLYTLAVRNFAGNAVDDIDVDINFTGPLRLRNVVLANHGLRCRIQGAGVHCGGGSLPGGVPAADPALVQLDLEARTTGAPTITATVNPNHYVAAMAVNVVPVTESSSVRNLPAQAMKVDCARCRLIGRP